MRVCGGLALSYRGDFHHCISVMNTLAKSKLPHGLCLSAPCLHVCPAYLTWGLKDSVLYGEPFGCKWAYPKAAVCRVVECGLCCGKLSSGAFLDNGSGVFQMGSGGLQEGWKLLEWAFPSPLSSPLLWKKHPHSCFIYVLELLTHNSFLLLIYLGALGHTWGCWVYSSCVLCGCPMVLQYLARDCRETFSTCCSQPAELFLNFLYFSVEVTFHYNNMF